MDALAVDLAESIPQQQLLEFASSHLGNADGDQLIAVGHILSALILKDDEDPSDVIESYSDAVFRQLHVADPAGPLSRRLASVLEKSKSARAHVLRRIEQHLSNYIRGQSPVTLQLSISPKLSEQYISAEGQTEAILASEIIPLIRFLGTFFTGGNGSSAIPESVIRHLLVLLGSRDDAVGYASRTAIIALLGGIKTSAAHAELHNSEDSVHSLIWARVSALLATEQEHGKATVANILAVWLKLVACFKDEAVLQASLRQDTYWRFLQRILLQGSDQQKKLGLAIMRVSIDSIQDGVDTRTMVIRKDHLESDKSFYQTFCTLFETIIISRYINQIEDSMPELGKVCAESSPVQPSWMFLLFMPAFVSALEDRNRRIIAHWLMDRTELLAALSRRQGIRQWCGEPRLNAFITDSFLGWAAQGSHFTGTLKKMGRRVICEHGAELSTFLEQLLTALSEAEAAELIAQIVNVYLIRVAPQNPTGLAFILHGIHQAAVARPQIITDRNVALFRQLQRPSQISLHPSGLRVVHILCQRVCTVAGDVSSPPKDADDKSIGVDGEDIGTFPTISPPTSFQTLLEDLKRTRYKYLRGEGLQAVCRNVHDILNRTTGSPVQDNEAAALVAILRLTWERLEFEDLPRAACHLFQELIFHDVCVLYGLQHAGFAELVSTWAEKLISSSKTRIATLPSLTRAIREAVFKYPKAIRALKIDSLLYNYVLEPPRAVLDFSYEESTEKLLEAPENGEGDTLAASQVEVSTRYGLGDGFTHQSYGLACVFDILNRLPTLDAASSQYLFDKIMARWARQKAKDAIVPAKWKHTTQLQAAFLLSDHVFSDADAKRHFEPLLHLLAIEPIPRFRILIEWILITLVQRQPDMLAEFLQLFERMASDVSNPKYLSSIVRTAVALTALPNASEDFYSRILVQLVTMSMYSSVAVRFESQWAILFIYQNAEQRGWKSVTENPLLKNIATYLHELKENSDIPVRVPPMRVVEDRCLAALVEGSFLEAQPPEDPITTRADFQLLWDEDTARGLDTSRLSQTLPLGPPEHRNPIKPLLTKKRDGPISNVDSTAPLQTKGFNADNILDDSRTSGRHDDLVLVASLIEYPVNLGGLSRCAEVLGAGSLYIPSRAILAHKEFRALSVSSEHHLPIHECPASALKGLLAAKKREGYTIVGIEQTDHSVVLGTARATLPKRAVFVLGSERLGMPGELMLEMDMFVEIRQLGIIRSLNVQTAAAVVLAEYVRQHR